MEGTSFLLAENKKHGEKYIACRKKPRFFLRISQELLPDEKLLREVKNGNKTEYVYIDQIIDEDVSESKLNHTLKRAVDWYKYNDEL